MAHLTLEEVIERINRANPVDTDQRPMANRTNDQPCRPGLLIPRITRRLANFMFSVRETSADSINALIHTPSDSR